MKSADQISRIGGDNHPPVWQARMVRRLRGLRRVRGIRRMLSLLLPKVLEGDFRVANSQGVFVGNLNSYIEREIYLWGGYEQDAIAAFLAMIPASRRTAILDIGANIGTHSIAFAKAFDRVHAFEPNREIWPAFERNVEANCLTNIRLHKFGLGVQKETIPFYSIAKDNKGLGTALPLEQYDMPLQQIGEINVEAGDEIVLNQVIGSIGAIKVDVQGFEPKVLAGLAETLRKHRPVLWVELGETNARGGDTDRWMTEFFGGEVDVYRFSPVAQGVFTRVRLIKVHANDRERGDYVIVPR